MSRLSTTDRLKMFIERMGITNAEFERTCGLGNGYVRQIKRSPSPTKLEAIKQNFPDLNLDWLLYEEGNMLLSEQPDPEELEGLPLVPIDALAGRLTGTSSSVMEYDCERFTLPMFNDADFLIRVSGDSMTPAFQPGDIVPCKKIVTDKLWFQWGKTYIIDTAQGALIKRVEPGTKEGFITLQSENSERYKPFELPIEEIYGMALVVGLIRIG